MDIMTRIFLAATLGAAFTTVNILVALHPIMPKWVKAIMMFSAFAVLMCLLVLLARIV